MVCFCICFPGETTVTGKQGLKRIDKLTPGEDILTSSTQRGTPKWTTFYTYGHREPDASAEFLVLTVSGGHQIKISRNHLIFVAKMERKVAKMARHVCKDDKLIRVGASGFLELLPVIEISTETLTGVYAPFTMSGHFLANGFLVGCYAEVDNFNLGHLALAPLRTYFKLRPSIKEDLEVEGIHGYAKKLMKIRSYLPTSFHLRDN